jgi:16S rRNA (adenine1518-N6/adenine1519-N6)-dimethyltransferase
MRKTPQQAAITETARLAADGLPPLGAVIAAHGLAPKKALGQNFLLDLNLTSRIARAAGDLADTTVLEIGPGPGGLTRALLYHGAKRVVAVERDSRCLAALAEIAAHYPGRLEVIEADALNLDPASVLEPPAAIVSNLPYNVGTELLLRWIRGPWPPVWQGMTLMFQREVAERIVATPGSKAYGRLGVLCGWRCEARILFDISPAAFTPPPKVTSSVVSIRPRAEPLHPAPLDALERVTAAAFGQRRKMLRQALKTLGTDPAPLLAAAGIDGTARAETLDIAAFCALARLLAG